jgi:hypothetical protein
MLRSRSTDLIAQLHYAHSKITSYGKKHIIPAGREWNRIWHCSSWRVGKLTVDENLYALDAQPQFPTPVYSGIRWRCTKLAYSSSKITETLLRTGGFLSIFNNGICWIQIWIFGLTPAYSWYMRVKEMEVKDQNHELPSVFVYISTSYYIHLQIAGMVTLR